MIIQFDLSILVWAAISVGYLGLGFLVIFKYNDKIRNDYLQENEIGYWTLGFLWPTALAVWSIIFLWKGEKMPINYARAFWRRLRSQEMREAEPEANVETRPTDAGLVGAAAALELNLTWRGYRDRHITTENIFTTSYDDAAFIRPDDQAEYRKYQYSRAKNYSKFAEWSKNIKKSKS